MDALEALEGQGVGLLELIAAGQLTRQRIIALGYPESVARDWVRLAETFLGPTRFRRLQAAAVTAAREGRLWVDGLRVVVKHARKLLKEAAIGEWELRVELCGLTGTVDEIDRAAAARVRDLNRAVPDAEKKAIGKRALKGGKNTDAQGLRTITVRLTERVMAEALRRLREIAGPLRRQDPKLGCEQAMADAFVQQVRGGDGPLVEQPPLVVMGVPDWVRLKRGEGDDTVFALTDGITITGAELLQGQLAEHGLYGLCDPVEGPVNLYCQQRMASIKQRLLLAVETILCLFPGCTTSADECQDHHLRAWRHGGDTNLANMSMACPVHNGRNDDDPNAPPRHGRVTRQVSGIVFHPLHGGPPTVPTPGGGLSAMALVGAQRVV